MAFSGYTVSHMKPESATYQTLVAAARMLDISTVAVHDLAREGRIRSYDLDGVVFVHKDDVAQIAEAAR